MSNHEYTPPRAILLNRAYNAITRADYTPESIEAAIETLFDAARTAAFDEAAAIADAIGLKRRSNACLEAVEAIRAAKIEPQ